MNDKKSDIEKILAERAKLDEVLRTEYTRKITVMFTDIKGSTAFYEQHGDVDGRLLVHRHNELVLPVIEQNRGVLIKTIGDATMSVYDDPCDAVRAALQIQKRLLEHNTGRPESEQINVRIGLNTGLGIVDEKDVFGDVVNTASRVEALADGGEIMVTDDLYGEVRNNKEFMFRFAESTKVKGKKTAIKAYRLVWHEEELSQGKAYKVPRAPQAKKGMWPAPRSPQAKQGAFVRVAKLLFSLVLAAVIVLLIVSNVSKGTFADGTAVATRVEGSVRIITREAPAGRAFSVNDSVAKNDQLEVQGNSRLELRLPDGGYLRLSDNARLEVRKLQFEEKTGTLNLLAVLSNGKLWAKATKHATLDSWVEVITGAALVGGKETVFGVDAVEGAGTLINVYEGVVLAQSAAKKADQAAAEPGARPEVRPVSLQALQQAAVSAQEGVAQPQNIDLKTAINDWVRWNLQRDAREGLASIAVAPAPATVTKGSSLQFVAVAHYPDNIVKDITPFATWSSSDMNIAKIDPSGTVAGAELGAATIAAAIEDVKGSTEVSVSRDIVSIKVTPASRSIANGAVQQFTAMGTFSDKTTKDISSSVVWRSSNPDVAFVDAAGRAVAGNAAGTAVISAAVGSKRGSATLKVRRELVSITIMPESAIILPGDTQRFGAIGNYSDKTTQDLTELVEWETSDISIAVMDQVHPGRVLGQKGGSAAITAAFKSKSGSATITVEMIPPP